MKHRKTNLWKRFQSILAFALIATASQSSAGGSLLSDIDLFLTGHYPVATAYLDLYDSSGAFIDGQQVDATGLLAAGFVNTGTEILFSGALTFPNLYPLTAGGSGGLLASVHDFSVDLATSTGSPNTDLVSMQVDWTSDNESISNTWNLTIGDDFINGIAYYTYSDFASSTPLTSGSANFRLEFATGVVTTVPLPAAVWLLSSGLIGLIGLARRKATVGTDANSGKFICA